MKTLIGTDGIVLEKFNLCLYDHIQPVNIFEGSSEIMEPVFDVHQGLVFGSLLFLTYIMLNRDLLESHGLNKQRYVDNAKIYLPTTRSSDFMSRIGVSDWNKDLAPSYSRKNAEVS